MKARGISNTAAYIAIKFYGLTRDPAFASLFSPATLKYYEELVQYLPSSLSWYHRVLSGSGRRKLFIFLDELLLPGDLMHIICRKYYLEKFTRRAFDNGFRQLLVLGAGFDHLGTQWAAKGGTAFEVDFKDMTGLKKDFLNDSGRMPANLFQIAADARSGNLGRLITANKSWDKRTKTLVVAEGFFDYQDDEGNEQVFQTLNAICPAHKLLCTYFSLDELNAFYRLSFKSGVALVGESIRLEHSKEEFKNRLYTKGYISRAGISYSDMYDNLIRNTAQQLSVLKGFYILEFNHRPDNL